MSEISIETCLDLVPNRFNLSILVMNRAKEILHGAKSKIETTKYTKKAVNKAIKEIENNEIDLVELREKIKHSLLVNNLFLKDNKNFEDNNIEDIPSKNDDYFEDDLDDLDDLDDDFEEDIDSDVGDIDLDGDDLE